MKRWSVSASKISGALRPASFLSRPSTLMKEAKLSGVSPSAFMAMKLRPSAAAMR